MTDPSNEPKDGAEAAARAMDRLRRAVLHRSDNPGVKEWQRVNDRNNFGPGIERSMRMRGNPA